MWRRPTSSGVGGGTPSLGLARRYGVVCLCVAARKVPILIDGYGASRFILWLKYFKVGARSVSVTTQSLGSRNPSDMRRPQRDQPVLPTANRSGRRRRGGPGVPA